MGELNLMDVYNVFRDLAQKRAANKYFSSPDYQDAQGQMALSGGLPSSAIAKSTNPYIKSGLDQAIESRLKQLSGGLTQAQTGLATAQGGGVAANTGMDIASFLKNGMMTPGALNANTDANKEGFAESQANRERGFLENQNPSLGPTTGTAQAVTGQNIAGSHQTTADAAKNNAMTEAFKAMFGAMPLEGMKNNFSDVAAAAAKGLIPGPIGDMLSGVMGAIGTRKAASADELNKLTSKARGDNSETPYSPRIENPYTSTPVQNATAGMQTNLAESQPPQPESWIDKILGGFSAFSPSMGLNRNIKPVNNMNDLAKVVNDTAQQVKTQLANLQTLDKTSSAGYNKYNKAVDSIQKLSKPLTDIYPHLQKMGYNPPPDLQAIMQQLMQLQRPGTAGTTNAPLDLNLRTK